MTDSAGEIGVIQALIDRFERQRLPRLLELKKKVDKGNVLSDPDVQFLAQVIHDAQQSKHLIDKHPEWHKFCSEVVHLYSEITEEALHNEQRS